MVRLLAVTFLRTDPAFDSLVPAKEAQMLRDFQTGFKPAAAQFPGYIDVKTVKLRKAFVGRAPGDSNYRFVLRYESEDRRPKWIASDIHQKVWGMIEQTLRNKNYDVLLFHEV